MKLTTVSPIGKKITVYNYIFYAGLRVSQSKNKYMKTKVLIILSRLFFISAKVDNRLCEHIYIHLNLL